MITVSDDPADVEIALRGGGVSRPGCAGRLRPWGSARPRPIRHGVGAARVSRWHRPRRARCSGCRVTHVLLNVLLAARRADAAEVIAGIERKVVEGWGHRQIAAWLDRPATRVRGWLRSFADSASRIAEWFTALALRDAPDAVVLWPAPAPGAPSAALSALLAYAAGLGRRFGGVGTVAWVRAGIAASDGRLFRGSFWAAAVQHDCALPAVTSRR